MASDDASDQCCLKMANVKGLVEAIHAIKSPHKNQVDLSPALTLAVHEIHEVFTKDCPSMQLCMLSVNRDGLSLRWEDSSKGMQSSMWLHSEVRHGLSFQAIALAESEDEDISQTPRVR